MTQPKTITDSFGTKRWYLNGKRHREDGPAVIYSNGDTIWYLNGKLHRTNGPAVEFFNNNNINPNIEQWWINGKEFTKKEFLKETQLVTKETEDHTGQIYNEFTKTWSWF